MIEQTGQLTRTSGERAWVRLGGQAGCPACDAGQGCGAGLFGRLLRRQPVELELRNDIGAQAGQAVTVGLPETVFLALVWRAYGLPLIAGLAGAVICHQITRDIVIGDAARDVASLFAGVLLGGLAGYWSSRRAGGALDSIPVQLLVAGKGQRACAGSPGPTA